MKSYEVVAYGALAATALGSGYALKEAAESVFAEPGEKMFVMRPVVKDLKSVSQNSSSKFSTSIL